MQTSHDIRLNVIYFLHQISRLDHVLPTNAFEWSMKYFPNLNKPPCFGRGDRITTRQVSRLSKTFKDIELSNMSKCSAMFWLRRRLMTQDIQPVNVHVNINIFGLSDFTKSRFIVKNLFLYSENCEHQHNDFYGALLHFKKVESLFLQKGILSQKALAIFPVCGSVTIRKDVDMCTSLNCDKKTYALSVSKIFEQTTTLLQWERFISCNSRCRFTKNLGKILHKVPECIILYPFPYTLNMKCLNLGAKTGGKGFHDESPIPEIFSHKNNFVMVFPKLCYKSLSESFYHNEQLFVKVQRSAFQTV